MKIAIDTSVVISVVTNEPHKKVLIEYTKEASLIAPESLHLEIGNAFSAMLKRKRISFEDALKAVHFYETIPIQLFAVDLKKSLAIANQLNIYAYDAYFIECAERNRCSLLTIDEGLIQAAKRYKIQVIEV